MNKQRSAADVAQCVELRPDILEAKGLVPSTTSNGWVETQGSVMESQPPQRCELEDQDYSLALGLRQLETYLDYVRLHHSSKGKGRQGGPCI